MKKYTLIVFLFISISTILAQPFNSHNTVVKIDSVLSDSFFIPTGIGIEVYDLTADSILFKKNEKLLLLPASNLKILTTGAALYFLGTGYNFKTSVYYTGKIDDGVLYGDLYVVGGCDPDFNSGDLDFLVGKIKSFGIDEIRGNLYGDISMTDSLFWGSGWMWDDDLSSDFPYMNALVINDQGVKIIVKPGKIGKRIEVNILPHSLYYTFENDAVTVNSDTSDFKVTRNWITRGNHFIISGTLSHNAEPDTLERNLAYTDKYFITLMKEDFFRLGVTFRGLLENKTLPDTAHLITTFNRPFGEIITNLLKNSDNLSAEMTLRALAYKYFGKPASAENGIKMIDSLITIVGLNPSSYRIADGSGVSRYNLITANLLVNVLKYFYIKKPQLYQVLYNSFPVAGVDGTLKRRMKNGLAYNNVHAKTGTLSGVSSLSGYLTAANNHKIIFSILIQNYTGHASKARSIQDKICEILSEMK